MVSSVLNAAGYTPGLFTSPHLHTFRERIRVEDQPIPEEEFAGLVEELWPTMNAVAQSGHGRVTVFELLLAMAFHCFRSRRVGAQVVEVGLGGRLDSTNLVQPLACGITSLGLDHTEVLGDTLEEIAGEKAGIIKPGVPVVCAPQQPEALAVVREVCNRQGSALVLAGDDITWEQESSSLHGQTFSLSTSRRQYRLQIPLLGKHQMENTALAVGIVEALVEGGLTIDVAAIEEGLRRVEWPCRLEVLQESPLLLADGAHNPHSAGRVVEAIKELFPHLHIVLIVGVSGNKDLPGLVGELASLAPRAVLTTRSRHPRAADPERIAREFAPYGGHVRATDTVSQALEIARDMASEGDLVLTTGSLFVAAEVRELVKGIPPEIYPVFNPGSAPTSPNA
jgi:dihydrofolate synthase/folylpolyglutamate synthase